MFIGYHKLKLNNFKDLLPDQKKLAYLIYNIINLTGEANVAFEKDEIDLPDWQEDLKTIDENEKWHTWIQSAYNIKLSKSSEYEQAPLPTSKVQLTSTSKTVGINLGGFNCRAVYNNNGDITNIGSFKIGIGETSLIQDLDSKGLYHLLDSNFNLNKIEFEKINFAISAPQMNGKIRPHSHLFYNSKYLKNEILNGSFQERISEISNSECNLINDGFANTIAAYKEISEESVLSLKIGTSIAAGIISKNSLLEIPLEFAKCVFTSKIDYKHGIIHPVIEVKNTMREAIGAQSLLANYNKAKGTNISFSSFIDLLNDLDEEACKIIISAAQQLLIGINFLSKLYDFHHVYISGKHINDSNLGSLIKNYINNNSEHQIILSGVDSDYNSAIGASLI